jgi:hypothetical protein
MLVVLSLKRERRGGIDALGTCKQIEGGLFALRRKMGARSVAARVPGKKAVIKEADRCGMRVFACKATR